MDQAKIFADAKETAPALTPLPAVGAIVRLTVYERARNPHVLYAYAAKTNRADGLPPLWPVRLTETSNTAFNRGQELDCRHLGTGYYEFSGPAPQKNS